MGTYFNYYIEYRTKDDGSWNLVSFNNPIKKCAYIPESIKNNKSKVVFIANQYTQGIIRDIFSSRGWYDSNLINRGFPKDVSSELKSILDKQMQDELNRQKLEFEQQDTILDQDKMKKGFIEYIPRNRDFDKEKDFCDFCWDRTYCTLEELSMYVDKQILHYQKQLEKYQQDSEFKLIHKKLDELKKLIQGKQVKSKKSTNKNENNEDYDFISEINETIDDFKYAQTWIYGINAIVNIYSNDWWIDQKNIRIIGYLN